MKTKAHMAARADNCIKMLNKIQLEAGEYRQNLKLVLRIDEVCILLKEYSNNLKGEK